MLYFTPPGCEQIISHRYVSDILVFLDNLHSASQTNDISVYLPQTSSLQIGSPPKDHHNSPHTIYTKIRNIGPVLLCLTQGVTNKDSDGYTC